MYRAKETFWAPGNRHIIKGDLVAPHDSVVKGREGLFEEVVIPRAVEPSEAASGPGPEEPEREQADDGKTGGETDPPEPAAADEGSTPAAAAATSAPAKKTTAKKTTAAARKPAAAGGDAK